MVRLTSGYVHVSNSRVCEVNFHYMNIRACIDDAKCHTHLRMMRVPVRIFMSKSHHMRVCVSTITFTRVHLLNSIR